MFYSGKSMSNSSSVIYSVIWT